MRWNISNAWCHRFKHSGMKVHKVIKLKKLDIGHRPTTLIGKERNMYATSADWSFDTKPDFETEREEYVSRMKEAGAINWFYVLTSDTTARSMTVWPDKETAHKALTMARDDAAKQNNQKITAVCEGDVLNGF